LEKPVSLADLRRIFCRILGIPEDQLPYEFYERNDELVARQTGYIEPYERWFKIYKYAQNTGRVEQAEDDRSWYFIFPKPKVEEKFSPLPLHLKKETLEENEKPVVSDEKKEKKPLLELGYYPEFPIDRIITHPFSFRVNIEEGLDQLMTEIHTAGMIIEPLICRPAEKPGYVELCAGERRLRAARMIGMRTVPIIVKEMDDAEFDRVRFLENLARKDLSDMETARVLKYMLEKYPKEYPSQQALADALGKSRQWVSYHLQMLKLEDLSTRVDNWSEILSKITEFQAREMLSTTPEKRTEIAEWIIKRYEETGEIPSASEIREFVHPFEAPPVEEEEPEEEAKPSITCARCGKPVTRPVHVKGKYYCDECAVKVLTEKEKPLLNKSVVQEALERTLFPIYPRGVDLETIRRELSEYDTYNLSDLLFELMRDGVIALNGRGRWMPREEYEKQQAVLDGLKAKTHEAEQILIDKYEGFDQYRGLETYKVSEIREIAKRNGPTEEFLEDLRRCVEAHKKLYMAIHGQNVFSPVKGDTATENIDRISRYLEKAKPVKLPCGPIGMMHRCPVCGRGGITEKSWQRLRRKYSQMDYDEFKKLWEAWK